MMIVISFLTAIQLNQSSILQFLGSNFQFCIPSFAELADERFLQKFIYRQVFFLSQQNCSLTHTPTMIVHCFVRTIIPYTDR